MLYAFIDISKLSIGNKIHAGMVAGLTDADIYWGLDEAGHDPYQCILKPIVAGCVSAPAVVERQASDHGASNMVFIDTERDALALTNSDMEFFSGSILECLSGIQVSAFDYELKAFSGSGSDGYIKPITYDDHCNLQNLIRSAAKAVDAE
ncbi:hypothetical protein [Pseudaeromonas pectinilytica]